MSSQLDIPTRYGRVTTKECRSTERDTGLHLVLRSPDYRASRRVV